MAKPNYAFAKRQRDLAKKNKKEEKRLRKAALTQPTSPDGQQPAAETSHGSGEEKRPGE
jgi:hypothetical protein